MVGVSAALHFLVDGLCVCCVYMMAKSSGQYDWLGVVLTYNILAFMTQPFTGMLADKVRHRHWVLLISVVLLALAVLAVSVALSMGVVEQGMWCVAVLLGMGNSLFHVWGGKQTVVTMGNEMLPIGFFVSTGAMGLAVGVVCHSWMLLHVFLLAICLLAILYVRMDVSTDATTADGVVSSRFGTGIVWLSMTALVAFVLFRSYTGEVFSSGVHKTEVVLLLVGAAAMLGKIAGGWLAERFGIIRSMVVVLAVVTVCFLVGGSNVVMLLLGVFMINCTMPVTLYLANVVLEGREGLAFGLLAAALLPGYLLGH